VSAPVTRHGVASIVLLNPTKALWAEAQLYPWWQLWHSIAAAVAAVTIRTRFLLLQLHLTNSID
jgi:hypothetical protein